MESDVTTVGKVFGKGRPRDGAIDVAVLAAARELLVELGYARLTVAAVADRAGTTKTALYRRWSGKQDLVHDATFADMTALSAPTGHTDDDLVVMVARVRELFNSPVTRAALPGLVTDMAADPEVHRRVIAGFAGVFAAFRERLVAAVADGEVRAGTDPDRVIEMMGGAAMLRALLFPGEPLDEEWGSEILAVLEHGTLAD
ncbi:TetR/AcrR family transcriptional regulator [Gordonia otitidis]|uniref:TetR family transcriptional regulator n=1 Tax=Gordonia otitidis (strain DSM 44809 / CCUG 52243 / JCM 12355 / NBRC 100426 / IFM 10032) TaxID=1108044 RepID=H5TN40_GORO1|nr:TetR/AcrR family transcriptional regulator [Gordonia otitidis]GAB34898.1 putative TetR family transcriptional regulator [Gordonia otitidis NBRC 100426]